MTQTALPSQIPVMVLPECNLLPHGLLPLFIFEPGYRRMLADSLAGDRMFAVGTVDPACDLLGSEHPSVLGHSCAGLIRACVQSPNGTSHLILQGLQRIRFTGWHDEHKPYRTARIEPVATTNDHPETAATLASKALELARDLVAVGLPASTTKTIDEVSALEDPEALADTIAYHLIRDALQRQPLLEMQDLSQRFRFIIAKITNPGSELP